MGPHLGVNCLAFVLLNLVFLCSCGRIDARDNVPDGYVAAPYYPSPHGGWVDEWSESYAKAQSLVEQMTLAEKTNITAGSGYFMGELGRDEGFATVP